MSADETAVRLGRSDQAEAVITTLASEIGPRRPTSRAERLAAEVLREALRATGVEARIESFPAYASFGYPYGAITALALVPGLLPPRWRGLRAALGVGAAGLLAAEGTLRHTPVSDLLAKGESRNVWAEIEPRGEVQRTLCLVAHSDTSRSGLIFHPALASHLQRLFTLPTLGALALAAAPLVDRFTLGRRLAGALRLGLAGTLALLAERELRGVDVPGANDNASGAGAVVQLASEVADSPLESTKVVVLITGAEEAGLLGACAFLDAHDTEGWLFLNFDGVAAPATLRYLPQEGIGRTWPADPGLTALAETVRAERPELGLERADGPLGLTYDATPVLARGGRALTIVAGDREGIPNYHQPTDTVENLDFDVLSRALEIGRELIAAVDRGDADPP